MIAVRLVDVCAIFLNYMLNYRLERTQPRLIDRPLDPAYHHYKYRDSMIAAVTLKRVVTMYVPLLLIVTECIAHVDANILRDYLYLNFTVYTLTNVIKLYSSRPRPYAKDIESRDNVYWNKWFESRKSFPSGHACNSLISGIAVARYADAVFVKFMLTDASVKTDPTTSLLGSRGLIQLVILAIGATPGVTQHFSRWHHVSDIASGYALAVAYYAAYHYALSCL